MHFNVTSTFLIQFRHSLPAAQILELEAQSEAIYSEGLASLDSESQERGVSSQGVESVQRGVPPSIKGVGPESNLAVLWECYFKWSLERHEKVTSFKSVKKKVCVHAFIVQCLIDHVTACPLG